LTVPLARFYATHHAVLPPVFRSFHTGPVWRAERPQKGRYRQFVQCDIDILGEPGVLAEVEVMIATADALTRVGVEGFRSGSMTDGSSLNCSLPPVLPPRTSPQR
jgi:Histidyl-tRNA synthetase